MKNVSSIVLTAALAVIFCSFVVSFGQEPTASNEKYSAPVAWTEYRIPSQRISILFPKFPVVGAASDLCSQTEGALYHAYAGGVVYEFEWHAKSHKAIPNLCPTKTKFSEATFTARLEGLKAQNWRYVESEATIAGISAKVLRSTSTTGSVVKTRWLVWQKDRWIEFGVTHRKATVVDEGRFSGGLKLSSSTGLDIGSGAVATFGDADVDLKSDYAGKTSEGLVIVTKPRPAYTEMARQSTIQGTVILRVTFLRNGGVGLISVIKALPMGLTEESIFAARRISFLPGTIDGKPVSITKQVEYTFSIY